MSKAGDRKAALLALLSPGRRISRENNRPRQASSQMPEPGSSTEQGSLARDSTGSVVLLQQYGECYDQVFTSLLNDWKTTLSPMEAMIAKRWAPTGSLTQYGERLQEVLAKIRSLTRENDRQGK